MAMLSGTTVAIQRLTDSPGSVGSSSFGMGSAASSSGAYASGEQPLGCLLTNCRRLGQKIDDAQNDLEQLMRNRPSVPYNPSPGEIRALEEYNARILAQAHYIADLIRRFQECCQ